MGQEPRGKVQEGAGPAREATVLAGDNGRPREGAGRRGSGVTWQKVGKTRQRVLHALADAAAAIEKSGART